MGDGGLREVEEGDQLAHADLPGVLAQHVHELEADRVAERLGHVRHPLGLAPLDVGVDDGLAARLASRALLFGGQLQIDGDRYTMID